MTSLECEGMACEMQHKWVLQRTQKSSDPRDVLLPPYLAISYGKSLILQGSVRHCSGCLDHADNT